KKMEISRENFRAMIFYDYKCNLTPKQCIDRLHGRYYKCNRILLLSHSKFHERIDAVRTFLQNGYPLHFIFVCYKSRFITDSFFTFVNTKTLIFLIFLKKRYLRTNISPYVKSVSESFRPIAFKTHRIDCNHNFDWSNVKILDRNLPIKKGWYLKWSILKNKAKGI
ncbi:hypothetical protein ALC56_11696, partial [Trachymyrmex septentrionalis]